MPGHMRKGPGEEADCIHIHLLYCRCDGRGLWSIHWYTSGDLSHSDDVRWKVLLHAAVESVTVLKQYPSFLL